MVDAADSTAELARRYRDALVEMDTCRMGGRAAPRRWNQLVDRMQSAHLLLKKSEAGRAAISELIHDEVPTVRLWSATNALAWDPRVAREELERQAAHSDLAGIEAKLTLREYDAGR